MERKTLERFLGKRVLLSYWDREEKELQDYEGELESIENEFVVINYVEHDLNGIYEGVARVFIADIRNISTRKHPVEIDSVFTF